MTHANERKHILSDLAPNGKGHLIKEALLFDDQLGDHCRMFSRVVLEPGCALGYHTHQGETETYYLLSGSGIYNDNGTLLPVTAGDVTFCEDGSGHGIENTGDTDLCFLALILKK